MAKRNVGLRHLAVLSGLLLFGTGSVVLASTAVAKAVRAETAEEALRLASDEVLALIVAGQSYADAEPDRFYRETEALLRPMIDFPGFARNVMGPYYKRATPEQRTRFAETFKWSLVRTYALALTEFSNGEVTVVPPRRPPKSPDKVNVTQEIKFEGKVYVVVYRMRRKAEQWQVTNLIVEGVNIGLNYKSQFAAAMKDPQYGGEMDAVIDAWLETNEPATDEGQPAQATRPTVSRESTAGAQDVLRLAAGLWRDAGKAGLRA